MEDHTEGIVLEDIIVKGRGDPFNAENSSSSQQDGFFSKLYGAVKNLFNSSTYGVGDVDDDVEGTLAVDPLFSLFRRIIDRIGWLAARVKEWLQ